MDFETIDSLRFPWFARLHWLAHMLALGAVVYAATGAALWFHLPVPGRFSTIADAPEYFARTVQGWALCVVGVTMLVRHLEGCEPPLTWRVVPSALYLTLRWWLVPLALVALAGHMTWEGTAERWLRSHSSSASRIAQTEPDAWQRAADDLVSIRAPFLDRGALLPGEEPHVPNEYDFERGFARSSHIARFVGVGALAVWTLLTALLFGLFGDSRRALTGEGQQRRGPLRSITIIGRTFDRE